MKNYSIKFPLEVVPGRETFATIDESEISELIKFNIKSTLLTCPGERRDDLEFDNEMIISRKIYKKP